MTALTRLQVSCRSTATSLLFATSETSSVFSSAVVEAVDQE
jgi:hypothetical protein